MEPPDDFDGLKTEQGQRRFWEAYYPIVYDRARVEARNSHDAEDITQDVFLRAFRSNGSFADRPTPKVWLILLCRRAAVDYYRRQPPPAPKQVNGSAPSDLGKTPKLVKDCIARERAERLRGWLVLLSLEQREVVELRVYQDLSVRETAELLGKSEAAVKMLMCRALQKLHSLEQAGGEEP